jgi:hypothetical protein
MQTSASLFHWRDSTPLIILTYSANTWNLQSRATSGLDSITVVKTFNAGEVMTVIAAWNSATIYLSVNGSVFTTDNRTDGVPDLSGDTTIDILSRVAAAEANGNVLWFAHGDKVPSDADAALIHSFGNQVTDIRDFPRHLRAMGLWSATNGRTDSIRAA